MQTPGPDHPIVLEPAKARWRVFFAGHVIADSNDALILREAALAPVVYFPRLDVAMEYMSRSPRSSHCPFKGDASYYTILMDGELVENVAWAYETPFPAMEALTGRIAFYPDKVEVYPVDDAAVNPQLHRDDEAADRGGVDQVVQHTDAGDGQTQRDHWRANVDGPQLDGGVS